MLPLWNSIIFNPVVRERVMLNIFYPIDIVDVRRKIVEYDTLLTKIR